MKITKNYLRKLIRESLEEMGTPAEVVRDKEMENELDFWFGHHVRNPNEMNADEIVAALEKWKKSVDTPQADRELTNLQNYVKMTR